MIIKILLQQETIGYMRDAEILKTYIHKYYNNYIVDIETINNFSYKYVDIQIFISNIIVDITKFAKVNMLLVNHELFLHYDKEKNYIRNIDVVLVRNNIGYESVSKIKNSYNYKYKINLIKFTSDIKVINVKKIWNMILHSAGEHHWKQTDAIIKAWLKFKNLPPIIIICANQCYKNISKLIIEPVPSNIILYNELIEYKKYLKIKNMIKIHLCPSIVEGYGHYINEARKLKSLVITTDMKPMNELINPNSGILIKCSEYGKKRNDTDLCFINENDIYDAVIKTINLDTKIKMIENAYNDYIKDTEYFDSKIKNYLSNKNYCVIIKYYYI